MSCFRSGKSNSLYVMNILFLTSTLPRFSNDSQAPFVLEQAFAWKKARPQDQIYILAPHDKLAEKKEQLNGINIYRFCYWWPISWQKIAYPAILPNVLRNPFLLIQLPAFLIAELLVTLKLIKRHKIDLLFAHWVMPQGLIGFIVHKLHKVPYGLKNYSSDLRIFNKIPFLGKLVARKIIQNSKVLFCENSMLRREALNFIEEKSRGELEKKIIALSMGVFHLVSDVSKNRMQNIKYDFGFIGRLSRKKGVDLFIQALKELKSRGVCFKAAVAGDGEERDNLNTMAKNIDIKFLGFVSSKTKMDFFKQSNFCIFPSCAVKGDVEGMPVALLEALYFGKIVIASRDTNIELLPDWKGIQKVVYLLKNPKDINEFTNLLQELLTLTDDEIANRTRKAQETLARYNWDNRIKEYMEPLISSGE